jgi:hypothetical protein
MDREAAVIRSEMNQTRAAIDSKISRLEARVQELSPREYVRRHTPDYLAERVIGSILTAVGIGMAWRMYRQRTQRREMLRAALSTGICY